MSSVSQSAKRVFPPPPPSSSAVPLRNIPQRDQLQLRGEVQAKAINEAVAAEFFPRVKEDVRELSLLSDQLSRAEAGQSGFDAPAIRDRKQALERKFHLAAAEFLVNYDPQLAPDRDALNGLKTTNDRCSSFLDAIGKLKERLLHSREEAALARLEAAGRELASFFEQSVDRQLVDRFRLSLDRLNPKDGLMSLCDVEQAAQQIGLSLSKRWENGIATAARCTGPALELCTRLLRLDTLPIQIESLSQRWHEKFGPAYGPVTPPEVEKSRKLAQDPSTLPPIEKLKRLEGIAVLLRDNIEKDENGRKLIEDGKPAAGELMERAKRLVSVGRLGPAVIALRASLQTGGAAGGAWSATGELYERAGLDEFALISYVNHLAFKPASLDVYERARDLARPRGWLPRLSLALGSLRADGPAAAEILTERVRLLLEQQQPQAAAALLQRLEGSFKGHPATMYAQALFLHHGGHSDAAEAVLADLLKRSFPRDRRWAECHALLGQVITSSRPEALGEAAACFTEAIDSDPSWPVPYRHLLEMRKRQGTESSVIAHEFSSLGDRHKSAQAFRLLGAYLLEQGSLDDSNRALGHAVILAPWDPEVFKAQAAVLKRQGRDAEAEQALIQALRLNPSDRQLRSRVCPAFGQTTSDPNPAVRAPGRHPKPEAPHARGPESGHDAPLSHLPPEGRKAISEEPLRTQIALLSEAGGPESSLEAEQISVLVEEAVTIACQQARTLRGFLRPGNAIHNAPRKLGEQIEAATRKLEDFRQKASRYSIRNVPGDQWLPCSPNSLFDSGDCTAAPAQVLDFMAQLDRTLGRLNDGGAAFSPVSPSGRFRESWNRAAAQWLALSGSFSRRRSLPRHLVMQAVDNLIGALGDAHQALRNLNEHLVTTLPREWRDWMAACQREARELCRAATTAPASGGSPTQTAPLPPEEASAGET